MKINVIGLGYVGLPLAVALAEDGHSVVGVDIDKQKISQYEFGIDITNEVGNERMINRNLKFSTKPTDSDAYIITVPTPINSLKKPDLRYVYSATESIADLVCKHTLVVYESTVCPGTTRKMKEILGDCHIGFSPERVAPATKVKMEDIVKVIASDTGTGISMMRKIYGGIINAGLHVAESIEVAEASKILENIQKDVNIALMNQMAEVFKEMGIDTNQVINSAVTKWDFNEYRPGLVGGHCIGVDPYYLIDYANKNKIDVSLLSYSRSINESVTNRMIIELLESIGSLRGKRIGVMGTTFKENCNDLRNSKVKDLIIKLRKMGAEVYHTDPYEQADLTEIKDLDAILVCVAHDEYKRLNKDFFEKRVPGKIIYDVKNIYSSDHFSDWDYMTL